MFENKELRRIFGPRRDEVSEDWRRLHNEEINLISLVFIRAISKLYICIPTNCTQLIYFINNTLKHMYYLKL